MEAVSLSPAKHTPASIAAGLTELVTLPTVYLEVRRIVNDPEAGIVDLASAISGDPAIAARLLRVANSAAYRTFHSVGTISQAVSILGMQRVHELALASALASAFDDLPFSQVNLASFWSRAVTCGAIARSLGLALAAEDVERLFVEGLLCEVGHLAMFQCAPECVSVVLAEGPLTACGVTATERSILGFSHAQVGAALLRAWELPERIASVVEFHCTPQCAPEQDATDAKICHLSWHAACSMGSEETLEERIEALGPGVLQQLGISSGQLDEAVEAGIQDAAELQEMFFPGHAGTD